LEQKLYQAGQYPLYVKLQELMEITSDWLSPKPVKFALFMPFFVIEG
jgi:hypothetical protein